MNSFKNQKNQAYFKKSEGGFSALISVLIVIMASAIFTSGFLLITSRNSEIARDSLRSEQSYYTAESGVEDSIYRIRSGKNYSFSNTLVLENSTSTVSISEASGIATINAIGDKNNLLRTVSAQLQLSSTGADFFYGVQVGDGGLEMDNNSEIIGNIYSNGSIGGESGSKITGDAIVASSLTEDNQARSIVCNTDQLVGKADPQIDYAQSFSVNSNGNLAKISLYIKKVGDPDSVNVRITNNNSGSPNNNSIAQGTLDKNLVTTTYGWVDVVLNDPVALIAGQTYWIVLDTQKNASKYWIWCSDSNNGYGNGVGKYSKDWDDDPWTQITGDLNFKTYFGSGVGTINGITILGDARASAITNSNICGNAYYQTIDPFSLAFLNSPTSGPCVSPVTNGTAYPGSENPQPSQMPISLGNIDQWKADAQVGGTITGDYAIDSNQNIGPKYITGNLLVNSNNKILTITGTVYVAGNIDISGNGSTIKCDPGYGSNSCIILTDGWVHIENNINFSGSGQSGSFLMVLSTLNCDGSGAQSGCTHHNGAMDVHNNANGVIFYAANGMINLHNGVNVTQATAYKLRIDNTATITYNSGLANASFSSGPSAGWKISNWKEVP